MQKSVYIFGDNRFALEIADNLKVENDVFLFTQSEESLLKLEKAGYINNSLFDLSDDWGSIFEEKDIGSILVFCALDSEAENLFLTISLRATFEKLILIGLVRDQASGTKLRLAGANKTLPFIQVTANIISEILEKPYVTDVIHNILYEKSDLKLAQIEVIKSSVLVNKIIDKIKWYEAYNIKVIAITNRDMETSYIYDKKLDNYALKEDDILVVIGYDKDIKAFELEVGLKSEKNWNNWGW